ncbi:MAG: D-tyrosyl-tRNA(Tyr) deacylase [Cellvibrionaceae bacterium]
MKGLIQRVSSAQVSVKDSGGSSHVIGAIDQGLLLLLGVEKEDDSEKVDKLLHKILNYRIFSDDEGKMNRSLLDIGGGLLVVSQFTLAAETRKGLRPGFSSAASPQIAESLYEEFVGKAGYKDEVAVQTGSFGADMQVSLVNDGPVTFLLEV